MLGFSLFIGQAFLYNAVTVTLGLTLTTYLGVGANKVGLFYAVFAAGNFLGPLLLGRLFDTVGRRPMIAGTYLISAVMLALIGIAFNGEVFSDWGLTLALAATFFFASAGASSAYLTVSEIFPMEIRALAIAFFYAIGTAIGGITGPLVFEKLGESGDVGQVMIAYLIGAAVMAVGGIAELFLGVRAEQKPLENIAKPITAREAEEGAATRTPTERSEAEERDRRNRERWERERMGLRRYRPGPGTGLVLAVPPAAVRAQPRLARPRGRDHRPGASGARRARPATSSPSGSAPATGARAGSARRSARRSATGVVAPQSAATATRRRARRRRGAQRARVEARCAARLRDPRPSRPLPRRAGRPWTGVRARLRVRGSKAYERGRGGPLRRGFRPRGRDDLGRRAPLSLFPLRLARRRSSAG